MHPVLKCFSYSLFIDFELLQAELRVNEAWVRMLARAKLMTSTEAARLLRGLRAIAREFQKRDPHAPIKAQFLNRYEDVHTLIQGELEKRVGSVAKKLHTGRSRNDLVVTSTRVYLRDKVINIQNRIRKIEKALLRLAKKAEGAIVAGMTHLKYAQPVLFAHHLLAYIEMLEEDYGRLEDSLKRIDVLPLGAAALAGSGLAIDQKFLQRSLGFSKIAANSLAAVSDRAFLTEAVSHLALLWVHLSRLSEDFVLWNSEPFGYIELDDAFSTGSSLMPQKKNPDVFELTRARSAAIFGHLQSLLTLQKGLPLAYNRDLQEDKPALFDAVRKTELVLDVLSLTIESARLNPEAMARSLEDDNLYATDLLDYLIRKGVASSEAHAVVGKVVHYAAEQDRSLRELSLAEWRRFSHEFGADVERVFDARRSVSSKTTIGSTHPVRVKNEIRKWGRELSA